MPQSLLIVASYGWEHGKDLVIISDSDRIAAIDRLVGSVKDPLDKCGRVAYDGTKPA